MKGELEETMLLNFCAGAKVKAILQHPEAAAIVQRASAILQKCGESMIESNVAFPAASGPSTLSIIQFVRPTWNMTVGGG
jgi:hypothetical protein